MAEGKRGRRPLRSQRRSAWERMARELAVAIKDHRHPGADPVDRCSSCDGVLARYHELAAYADERSSPVW